MADDPKVPKSPDELQGGLRGRISGVTRIGGRAFLLAFLVVTGLLLAILYGVTKKPSTAGPANVPSSSPVAPPSGLEAFGHDVPVVPTAPPEATAPPPVLEAPTAVPNVENTPSQNNAASNAAAQQSAAQAAADQKAAAAAAAAEAKRAAEEKARLEALEAARRSKILIGEGAGVNQSGGNLGTAGGGVALSFAGNGSDTTATNPGTGGGAGGGSTGSGDYTGSNSSGSGGGSNSNALLGRPNPQGDTAANPNPTDDPNAFLLGPTRQYAVQRSNNVILPPGGNPVDFLQSQRFQPISPFEVTASSVIPATLITGIDSEKAGLLSALVREDVYDTKTGKYLLIPKGTKLVGLYERSGTYGASRVSVAWTRLIFPDTTSIDLNNMSGADTGGFAGFGGDVDNHYGRIIGTALLSSLFAAGAAIASGTQNSIGGLNQNAGQTVSSTVANNILNLGTTIENKNLSIPPVIYVAKGYPFIVFVDRDMVFPGPYGTGL